MNRFGKIKPRLVASAVLCAFFFSVSAFFWFAFYFRFWKWRVEILQAQSSFITPEGDNLISAGAFWAVPALQFFNLGLALLMILLLHPKKRGFKTEVQRQ